MTGRALGHTGTAHGTALGTTGIGTTVLGTVGTPLMTTGGLHQVLINSRHPHVFKHNLGMTLHS